MRYRHGKIQHMLTDGPWVEFTTALDWRSTVLEVTRSLRDPEISPSAESMTIWMSTVKKFTDPMWYPQRSYPDKRKSTSTASWVCTVQKLVSALFVKDTFQWSKKNWVGNFED